MNEDKKKMITLVCGFPRCGSTLTMRILHAAGMPVLADGAIGFEYGRMLDLPDDHAWIEQAEGKALKLLDPQIYTPPPGRAYRAIWLERNAGEQARSTIKMLIACQRAIGPARLGVETRPEKVAMSLIHDRPRALATLRGLTGDILELRFEDLIETPVSTIRQLVRWAGLDADVDALARLVDRRSSDCLRHIRELREVQS